MGLFRRSTKTIERVVLTFDPAITRDNSAEVLAEYRRTGDISALTVPADALVVEVRPLSVDDRFAVEDAIDGLAVEAIKVDVEDGDARTALGLRIARRRSLATCRAGIVRATENGEAVEGADRVIAMIPQDQIARFVAEVGGAIQRMSTVDADFA
jgi:hypothetical protein